MQLLTSHSLMPGQFLSSSPWLAFPLVFILSMISCGLEYPWGQLSWLCPLPASCVPHPPCWWGEKLKGPWLAVSTAQQQLQYQCVIDIILIHGNNLWQPPTRKKFNSIPAGTRTDVQLCTISHRRWPSSSQTLGFLVSALLVLKYLILVHLIEAKKASKCSVRKNSRICG